MENTQTPGRTTSDRPDPEHTADAAATKPLEWSADAIRRMGYRVIDLIAEYLTTLPSKPVFQPCPQELAAEFLHSSPPESGQDVASLLDEFADKIAPYPFGQGHPRFWGFVNPPPTVIGIF